MTAPSKPSAGLTGQKTFRVEPAHCITFAGAGLPEVLSTPALIQFLEMTARETVQPFLSDAEVTLGTSIELNHLAPSPLGQEVTCSVRVVRVDGLQLSFALEARDRLEIIAKGFHTRAIILKARFHRRVARKQSASS